MTTKKKTTAIAERKPRDAAEKFVLAISPDIQTILPRKEALHRFARVLMTEIRKNPRLLECNRRSLGESIMQAARLNLEIGEGLNHCYLVPFKKEAKLMLGYQGLLTLVKRSKAVASIYADVVREGDNAFKVIKGTDPHIDHEEMPDNQNDLVAVYAVAKHFDGSQTFVVLWKSEVEKIKKCSRSAQKRDKQGKLLKDGPWWGPFESEMWKKSAIRRLCKQLPKLAEDRTFNEALDADNDDYDLTQAPPTQAAPERNGSGTRALKEHLQGGDDPTIEQETGEAERLTVEMAADGEAPDPKKEEEPRQQFNPEECTYCNEKLDTETKSNGSVVGYCKNKKCDNWMRKVEI